MLSDRDLNKCEYCGFIYDSPEFFVRKRHYWIDSAKIYCQSCVDLAVDRTLAIYLFVRLGWLGYALFAYHVQGYPQLAWLVVNIVLMGFLGFFVVLLHELGHALTALVLKMRVYGIQVGQGNELLSFETFGHSITINKLPFLGGFTYLGFRDGEESVWRLWLATLAGPLTNLIIFIIILAFVGFDELIEPVAHGFKGIELFTIIAFDNIVVFVANMIPGSFVVKGKKYDRDGKFLLLSPFRRQKTLTTLRIATLVQHGSEAYQNGEYVNAAHWFKRGVDEFPDNLLYHYWYAASLYINNQYQSALKYLDSIIDENLEKSEDKFYAANIFNLYAWIIVLEGNKSKMDLADKYSNKAGEILKDEAAILDTRGSIDIELGNISSGKELLSRAIKLTPILLHKTAGLCSLAIAEIKSGDLERACFLRHLIALMEQEPELLPRLDSMLKEKCGHISAKLDR